MTPVPARFTNPDDVVEAVLSKVGHRVIFGMPLGLGKPNHLANALYNRAAADPKVRLTIVTALTLEKPSWSSDLERRFLEPFVERVFGGYPDLAYAKALRAGSMPANIDLVEFYFKPGGFLNVATAQQNYISTNYTHAMRDILSRGVNVVGQIVRDGTVDGEKAYSLSCNPEVSQDLLNRLRDQEKQGKKIAVLAQVNNKLPFMYGDAVVPHDTFDMVLDHPDYHFRLFGPPKMNISTPDFMIGLFVSSLVKDGGTLQIGIGSLGDALVYGLILRQQHNEPYRAMLADSGTLDRFGATIAEVGGAEPFDEGLCGSTEMLVDGYLQLLEHGVVKRKTYNDIRIQRLVNQGAITEKVTPDTLTALWRSGAVGNPLTPTDVDFLKRFGILKKEVALKDGVLSVNGVRAPADLADPGARKILDESFLGDTLANGILIHGGFFLGPESFYRALNEMTEDQRRAIHMTSVLNVNQLYGGEELRVLQRRHGRFANAGLMACLSGAVVSDGLENGQVVSGVGGQYNFVAMAHALPEARSILMIRALRSKGKEVKSNVVFNYGHCTIPRHLRDIVVTEYGIADLKSKTDAEVIAALVNIADSRFQEDLLAQAKAAGKIQADYRIPDRFRNNYPERVENDLAPFKKQGFFPAFPFGTDFTAEELVIGKALKALKAKMSSAAAIPVPSLSEAKKMWTVPERARPYLKRLDLDKPASAKEKMLQRLVVYALASQGVV